MRAGRAYELLVTRGGRGWRLLAPPDRVDHLEVVEIDSGEVVLFWDCLPADASRMARALRADLAQLEADAFLDRWTAIESVSDLP
ncbi:hypothetical protein GKE82_13625 [Conexibacter sp. W3-3-2]|uniref:hypothetical protein n=1 Tax=Conexibacter sp. W3-3-2 TaxID=2675227 RepID=UPI0012B8025F|nr:hypothetical protein [Conexibacter sp. W3-3-2]MTD45298.1 hypothetical protein [Conexibacter sp. W3-3-2]